MKDKKYIFRKSIIFISILSLLYGCVNLDEDLTGQPTPDKFFSNIADFKGFIAGAYIPLIQLWGSDAPYIATAGGEDVNVNTVPRWKGFEIANVQDVANPEEITDVLWNNSYSSISTCNTTLTLIKNNEKVSSGDLIPINGEAHFLRAFNYFNLVRWFGEVPLLTEDNQSNAVNEEQSGIEEIYDFIVSDLIIAETDLPASQSEVSRPTKWAAKALLSKIYLTMGGYPLNQRANFEKAMSKAEEVITSNVYSLEPDFFDLWLWQNRNTNSEFIFTLYASSNSGTGGYINRAVRPSEEGGWADWTSDVNFLNNFPVGDGNRLKGTFYLNFNDAAGNISWKESNVPQPYVGKLRDGGDKSGGYYGNPVANLADGFYCMLRYSDVLLIYAEAANQVVGNPTSEAYNAVNKVRQRAGLPALSGLSHDNFDQAVLDERNWELAFECNRWFDMCRKHIVSQTIKFLYPGVTITDDNYLLPKPKSQLAIMKGVKQNPGYNN